MEFPIHVFNRPLFSHSLSVTPTSENPFPGLWQVPEPPDQLFVQGSAEALELLYKIPERGLAIVGTRNPQVRSTVFLKNWIHELEGTSLILVSGLARGIDTIAHTEALKVGLPTIAVLGAGLDLDYPKENRELRQAILKANGLIMTEFPLRTGAHGHHFLRRNRLIAGWSKATWVVEAGLPSGALSTARWAREQDRTCFTVPCFPGDPTLAGNQVLLDQEHAFNFWGVHSLGAVWIDLASRAPKRRNSSKSPKRGCFHSELADQVRILTHRQGGAHLSELLDWAHSRGWSSQQFFKALQRSVQDCEVVDQRGILVCE